MIKLTKNKMNLFLIKTKRITLILCIKTVLLEKINNLSQNKDTNISKANKCRTLFITKILNLTEKNMR